MLGRQTAYSAMPLFRLTSFIKPSKNWTRLFATSAQKRKWKRKAMKKSPKRTPEASEGQHEEAVTPNTPGGFLRPFLFLGVMPLIMSSLVIWSRGDLLQDVTGQRLEPIRKEFKAAQEEKKNYQKEGNNIESGKEAN